MFSSRPNHNGRIYPPEGLKKAMEDYIQKQGFIPITMGGKRHLGQITEITSEQELVVQMAVGTIHHPLRSFSLNPLLTEMEHPTVPQYTQQEIERARIKRKLAFVRNNSLSGAFARWPRSSVNLSNQAKQNIGNLQFTFENPIDPNVACRLRLWSRQHLVELSPELKERLRQLCKSQ